MGTSEEIQCVRRYYVCLGFVNIAVDSAAAVASLKCLEQVVRSGAWNLVGVVRGWFLYDALHKTIRRKKHYILQEVQGYLVRSVVWVRSRYVSSTRCIVVVNCAVSVCSQVLFSHDTVICDSKPGSRWIWFDSDGF